MLIEFESSISIYGCVLRLHTLKTNTISYATFLLHSPSCIFEDHTIHEDTRRACASEYEEKRVLHWLMYWSLLEKWQRDFLHFRFLMLRHASGNHNLLGRLTLKWSLSVHTLHRHVEVCGCVSMRYRISFIFPIFLRSWFSFKAGWNTLSASEKSRRTALILWWPPSWIEFIKRRKFPMVRWFFFLFLKKHIGSCFTLWPQTYLFEDFTYIHTSSTRSISKVVDNIICIGRWQRMVWTRNIVDWAR
jgi:hypothetical protein